MVARVVVEQEQLIGEDGGEKLGAVVVESAMPDAVVEIEACLEPVVEWFDTGAPAADEFLGKGATEELRSLLTSRAAAFATVSFTMVAGGCSGTMPGIGTQQPTTRSLLLLIDFDRVCQIVAVITGVGQNVPNQECQTDVPNPFGGTAAQPLDTRGLPLESTRPGTCPHRHSHASLGSPPVVVSSHRQHNQLRILRLNQTNSRMASGTNRANRWSRIQASNGVYKSQRCAT